MTRGSAQFASTCFATAAMTYLLVHTLSVRTNDRHELAIAALSGERERCLTLRVTAGTLAQHEACLEAGNGVAGISDSLARTHRGGGRTCR